MEGRMEGERERDGWKEGEMVMEDGWREGEKKGGMERRMEEGS